MPITKQHNLVLVKGQRCTAAGRVTLSNILAIFCWVYDYVTSALLSAKQLDQCSLK